MESFGAVHLDYCNTLYKSKYNKVSYIIGFLIDPAFLLMFTLFLRRMDVPKLNDGDKAY